MTKNDAQKAVDKARYELEKAYADVEKAKAAWNKADDDRDRARDAWRKAKTELDGIKESLSETLMVRIKDELPSNLCPYAHGYEVEVKNLKVKINKFIK